MSEKSKEKSNRGKTDKNMEGKEKRKSVDTERPRSLSGTDGRMKKNRAKQLTHSATLNPTRYNQTEKESENSDYSQKRVSKRLKVNVALDVNSNNNNEPTSPYTIPESDQKIEMMKRSFSHDPRRNEPNLFEKKKEHVRHTSDPRQFNLSNVPLLRIENASPNTSEIEPVEPKSDNSRDSPKSSESNDGSKTERKRRLLRKTDPSTLLPRSTSVKEKIKEGLEDANKKKKSNSNPFKVVSKVAESVKKALEKKGTSVKKSRSMKIIMQVDDQTSTETEVSELENDYDEEQSGSSYCQGISYDKFWNSVHDHYSKLDPMYLDVKVKSAPFRIKLEDMKFITSKWLSGLWGLPNSFSYGISFSEAYPVYIPYWNLTIDLEIAYNGYIKQNTNDPTSNNIEKTSQQTIRLTHTTNIIATDLQLEDKQAYLQLLKEKPKEFLSLDEIPKDIRFERYEYSKAVPAIQRNITRKQAWMNFYSQIKGKVLEQCKENLIKTLQTPTVYVQENEIVIKSFERKTKVIIMPFYFGNYLFEGKSYNFVVSGLSGIFHGERPYSVVKLVLYVVLFPLFLLWWVLTKA